MENNNKFKFASVTAISLSHFFHDVYSYFLSPVLPILRSALGISYSQAGLLSIIQRFPALLNPAIGSFCANKPAHIVLALSIIVTAVSMCFITVSPSYLTLAAIIFLMGVSSLFFHIPAAVMIKRYAGSKTGTGMSFFMFGGEMARAAAPITVLGAISLWGVNKVYYLIPIAAAAGICFIIIFRNDESWRKKAGNVNIASLQSGATAKTTSSEDSFFKVLGKMKLFFFTIFMIMLAKASIAAVLNAFLPVYLTSNGQTLWFSGISLTVLQISAAIGTVIAGPVSDYFGKNNTLLVISFFSPVLMFLFVFFSSSSFALVFIIFIGFVGFSPSPVVMSYVQDAAGKNNTVCSSIYMLIDFSTIALTVVFAGITGDIFSLKTSFTLCAVISCLGFPFVLLLRAKLKLR